MKKKIFITLIFFIFFLAPICYGQDIDISAPAAILVDSNTGKILYEKNSNQKMYPASTTKMITAIIAIEKCNLDEIVTISNNAVSSIPSSYASLELKIGEKLTVENLLHALLMCSSNIAGNALAEHISGNTSDFATLMNNKAKEIGCKNSHFVNPYGLHNDNHYTTAYDLYMIARYGMQNEIFRSIVAKKSYEIPATNMYRARTINNTNELLRKSDYKDQSFVYEGTIGVKTGFTGHAGECLVAACKKDNFEIFSVVLGCKESDLKYIDTTKLFNFAYENFEYKRISEPSTSVSTQSVRNSNEFNKKVELYPQNEIYAFFAKDQNLDVEPEIIIDKTLVAPLQKGDIVGEAVYRINDVEYKTNLVIKEDVEAKPLFRKVLEIAIILLLIIIVVKFAKKITKDD